MMGMAELLLLAGGGLLLCALVGGGFGYVAWTLVKANKVVAAGEAAIRSGQIPDALPWTSASIGTLSADWVGASTYKRGFGGASDRASGQLQAVDRPGTVVAFQTDARGGWQTGRLEAVGPGRVVIDIAQDVAQVRHGEALMGTISLATGEIRLATGQPAGRYVRDARELAAAGLDDGRSGPRTALLLGNAPVALLDARTESHETRPAVLRPLVLRYEPGAPAAEPWTLVVCLLELGWFGVAATHASIRRPSH